MRSPTRRSEARSVLEAKAVPTWHATMPTNVGWSRRVSSRSTRSDSDAMRPSSVCIPVAKTSAR